VINIRQKSTPCRDAQELITTLEETKGRAVAIAAQLAAAVAAAARLDAARARYAPAARRAAVLRAGRPGGRQLHVRAQPGGVPGRVWPGAGRVAAGAPSPPACRHGLGRRQPHPPMLSIVRAAMHMSVIYASQAGFSASVGRQVAGRSSNGSMIIIQSWIIDHLAEFFVSFLTRYCRLRYNIIPYLLARLAPLFAPPTNPDQNQRAYRTPMWSTASATS